MSAERPNPLPDAVAPYVYAGRVPYPYRRWDAFDVERAVLLHMVRAGWTRDAAWTTVRASHPKAFGRIRSVPEEFGTFWREAGGPEPEPVVEPLTDRVVAETLAAAVSQVWSRLHLIPRRARPRAVQVALSVLARCARERSFRVRVPLRSVQLATGMRSRGSVAVGLREASVLLGELHEAFDPRRPLDSSHELEIVVEGEAASGPLGTTHPLPALWAGDSGAVADWAGLPGDAPLVWAAVLTLGGDATRSEVADLVAAGSASRQTNRTVKRVLDAMASTGLVTLTQRRVHLVEDYRDNAPDDLARLVRDERRRWAFRCHAFDLQRVAVLRAELRRHRAWWEALPEEERDARRDERRARFAALPCEEQERHRQLWEARRRRAAISVQEAHTQWCEERVTVERRRARRAWFREQPPERKRELVASWQQWRLAHTLGRYRANRKKEAPVRKLPEGPREPCWPLPGWYGTREGQDRDPEAVDAADDGPPGGAGTERPAGVGGRAARPVSE